MSIEIVHLRGQFGRSGEVTVVSARDPYQPQSEAELAREALSQVIGGEDDWQERSEAGRAIWLRTRARLRERTMAQIQLRTDRIRLAGAPQRFSIADAGRWWTAARISGEQSITITARGPSPSTIDLIVLKNLDDLISASRVDDSVASS
jgi:hypothetical protein